MKRFFALAFCFLFLACFGCNEPEEPKAPKIDINDYFYHTVSAHTYQIDAEAKAVMVLKRQTL